MDLSFIFSDPLCYRLLVAAGLGALIGLERELAGKDPSLRTFALISLGSCGFTILSDIVSIGSTNADPGRIAAQIVPGIGFIGAGAIFRSQRGVSGLTTAALMWVTAAIGMSVGYGRIQLAATTTALAVVITFALKLVHKFIRLFRPDFYAKDADQ